MPPRTAKKLSETDLYLPIYEHLVAQGYTVRSEVRNCDLTATKDDELIVVELKRQFSTQLLIQAAKRQRVADSVYVALPRPALGKKWADIRHLLRRLELGLILVSFRSRKPKVEVAFHPLPFERKRRNRDRRAILREIVSRSGDFNRAGSHRRPLATAYREEAIHIACHLEHHGPLSPRALRALGTGPKTRTILYGDVYGWFERVDRALYALRPQGAEELARYPQLAAHYRALVRERSKLGLFDRGESER